MFRLAILAVSIGLADSLNPSTVAPALYLATSRHPRRQVAEFAIGVFAINLLAGLLIVLGPGQLLLSLVPHPNRATKHGIEVGVGLLVLAVAAGLWLRRKSLAARPMPATSPGKGSAFVVGAGIAALELPTAVVYFAVIATIVGSGRSLSRQISVLTAFNLAFIAPVLVILLVLMLAGKRAEPGLAAVNTWLQRRWPTLLAGLAAIIGSAILIAGAGGFIVAD